MTTTYPLLGTKYLLRGMQKAFPATTEGTESTPFKIAEQYGSLMRHNDFSNLYSAVGEKLEGGAATKTAEWMLKPMLISNNSNRLVAFWGHAEKALDAAKEFLPQGDIEKFVKQSGLTWLDKPAREMWMKRATEAAADPSKYEDLSRRIAKEMVDISQWNYQRGASPGIYKYALGRLFGQYGTWPLNYVEYARRLATQGDGKDRALALGRLALAHGAMLKAGEDIGVDTASWVFTSPAGYSMGPVFNATTNLSPALTDFQTQKGDDARRQVGNFLKLTMPGSRAVEDVYKAITNNDPELYKILLGFRPMRAKDEDRGLHALTP